MHQKIKFTVVKVFSTKEVLGHEVIRASGKKVPICPVFREGQEIIAKDIYTKPEAFCGTAWRDLTNRLTKFDIVEDMDWPEKNVTYCACGDGLRPVIFKVEKMT